MAKLGVNNKYDPPQRKERPPEVRDADDFFTNREEEVLDTEADFRSTLQDRLGVEYNGDDEDTSPRADAGYDPWPVHKDARFSRDVYREPRGRAAVRYG